MSNLAATISGGRKKGNGVPSKHYYVQLKHANVAEFDKYFGFDATLADTEKGRTLIRLAIAAKKAKLEPAESF